MKSSIRRSAKIFKSGLLESKFYLLESPSLTFQTGSNTILKKWKNLKWISSLLLRKKKLSWKKS